MKPMPPGWHVAVYPLPPVQRDVLKSDGKLLRAFAPGVRLPRRAYSGPWPERALYQSWFRSPSGRRLYINRMRWQIDRWEDTEDEPTGLKRICIDLDYGGAYSWDTHGRCTSISYHLGDESGVLGLEAAFERWQDRYEQHAEWVDGSEPEGGWHALAEDGLTLCMELAHWVGPEGHVIYRLVPTRLSQAGRPLVFTWEPGSGTP